MKKNLEICGLNCLCCPAAGAGEIAYVLYPMDVLDSWIENAAANYNVSIVVITGMDWDNVFSPWPAPGEPPGQPDFRGESPKFLELLTGTLVPQLEKELGLPPVLERTLVGVSMSGLFALWQWMVCADFQNIASLSGSFWFPGFIDWMKKISVPDKKGKGFFLLGNQESKSPVKAFESVEINTREALEILKNHGIDVEFESVPGNHFSDPIPRLDRAFKGIYGSVKK